MSEGPRGKGFYFLLDTRTCFRFLALFLLPILAACGQAEGTPDPTLAPATQTTVLPSPTATATPVPAAATVNGDVISLDEFNAELIRFQQAQEALGKTVPIKEAEERVLNDLIAQTLLAQAAHEEGFTLTDAELEARIAALTVDVGGQENLSTWLASHNYTRESLSSSLQKAISAAWMRDKILADVPESAEQVHAQQILLYNLETAQEVQANLSAGADFSELASAYDPVTHGELFWFPQGYLLDQSIETIAFSLDVGEPSKIIETEVGFHIIIVLEKDADRPLSPDALLALQENALSEWLEKAEKDSKIEK